MLKPAAAARIAGGAVGLAVLGGLATIAMPEGLPGAPAAAAASEGYDRTVSPDAVAQQEVLKADAILAAAEAGLNAAHEKGQQVTIAIVDRSGSTRLVLKTENAGPQTQESAERKAFTAVSFGQPTSALTEGASGDEPNLSDIPGTLFLAGGVPVISNGTPIAGIGVGGAPDGAIDEEIARAALHALETYRD
ncbi:heme-binding protein [Nocardiopsis alba]|uniref:GlcG/HbpS family heme-binding protein n=1 Tax=Nocardiopsis alba TaxID=53437 RepID=UPI0005A803AA|nr:heme-binding protein [Nocardiopsis alba]